MVKKIKKSEKWKPMYGYETRYLISNYGRVKSLWVFDNRFIKLRCDRKYWSFNARNGDGTKGCTKFIHSSVLETFGSLRPKGMQCRHIDGDSNNNYIGNLRWGTPKQNMMDSKKNGRIFGYKGSSHPIAKLNDGNVFEIRKLLKDKRYSQKIIGEMFNVNKTTISNINVGKSWSHLK